MKNALVTLKRDPLLVAINLVRGAVERKNHLPILSHVLVQATDSRMTLMCSSLESEVLTDLDTNGPEFETTLPSDKLADILKALPSGSDVTLSIGASSATLQGGNGRYRLASLHSSDFPRMNVEKDATEWNVQAGVLLALLRNVGGAMSVGDVRYYLNGTHFNFFGNSVEVVATDGHRLAVSSYPSDDGHSGLSFICPRNAVALLCRVLESVEPESNVELRIGEKFLVARAGNTVVRSRLVDGKYPDYQNVIPKSFAATVRVDRAALSTAVRMSAIVSDQKNKGVTLSFSNNSLHVSSKNAEDEQSNVRLDVEYSGADAQINFNAHYLLDAVDAFDGEFINIGITDTNSAVVIRDVVSASFLYVVMPMRL